MYFVAHFGEVEKIKTFRCEAEQLACRRNKIEKKKFLAKKKSVDLRRLAN